MMIENYPNKEFHEHGALVCLQSRTGLYRSGNSSVRQYTVVVEPAVMGEALQVELDWKKIISREDAKKDVIGFIHTHPPGHFKLSKRDIATMKAWVTCLGKSLFALLLIPSPLPAGKPRLRCWRFFETGRYLEVRRVKVKKWLIEDQWPLFVEVFCGSITHERY